MLKFLLLAMLSVVAPKQPEAVKQSNAIVTVFTQAELDAALRGPAPGVTIQLKGNVDRVVVPDGTQRISIVGAGGTVISKDGSRPPVAIGLRCADISLKSFPIERDPSIDGQTQYIMVGIGYDSANSREASTVDELANRVLIDGLTIRGTATSNTRIGILGNARNITIQNCDIREIHEVGADSQAVLQTNTPGPSLIRKNHLEAAGEVYMSGGSVPTIKGLQLADLTFSENECVKPLRWYRGSSDYDDSNWSVKNLFELKGMVRASVRANIFSNNWEHAQNGIAILFTPRDGSRVADVSFADNWINNVGGGLNCTGADSTDTANRQHTGAVECRNNRWIDVGALPGAGTVYTIGSYDPALPIDSITIESDVAASMVAKSVMFFDGKAGSVKSLSMRRVAASYGRYGILGTEMGPGDFSKWVVSGTYEGNVFLGGSQDSRGYPAGFLFR